MRVLADIPNTDAPSTDYPGGKIRDKNISVVPPVIGTPITELIYGDIVQFFQRLLVLGSVTANNLTDNVTNGFQTITALWAAIRGEFTASNVETIAGTVNDKYVTPASLAAKDGGLRTVSIEIGDWDMDSTAQKSVTGINSLFTIPVNNIRGYDVIIRSDADDVHVPKSLFNSGIDGISQGGISGGGISGGNILTQITLSRTDNSITIYGFDNDKYDQTSYNRGWIKIDYIP